MATQFYRIPSGNHPDKALLISPMAAAAITMQADNEVETLGECPAGTTEIFNARRQCGDWNCEIARGLKRVCAVGTDQAEAFRNALARSIASPAQ